VGHKLKVSYHASQSEQCQHRSGNDKCNWHRLRSRADPRRWWPTIRGKRPRQWIVLGATGHVRRRDLRPHPQRKLVPALRAAKHGAVAMGCPHRQGCLTGRTRYAELHRYVCPENGLERRVRFALPSDGPCVSSRGLRGSVPSSSDQKLQTGLPGDFGGGDCRLDRIGLYKPGDAWSSLGCLPAGGAEGSIFRPYRAIRDAPQMGGSWTRPFYMPSGLVARGLTMG
jgi:hypothetical protein